MVSRRILQIGVLVVGVALIVAGIFLGELVEIKRKAVIVCLECIGIG